LRGLSCTNKAKRIVQVERNNGGNTQRERCKDRYSCRKLEPGRSGRVECSVGARTSGQQLRMSAVRSFWAGHCGQIDAVLGFLAEQPGSRVRMRCIQPLGCSLWGRGFYHWACAYRASLTSWLLALVGYGVAVLVVACAGGDVAFVGHAVGLTIVAASAGYVAFIGNTVVVAVVGTPYTHQ